MTSSMHVGENVNFSCMKAAYSQRSIEKAVSEGRISARDIALIKEFVNERSFCRYQPVTFEQNHFYPGNMAKVSPSVS